MKRLILAAYFKAFTAAVPLFSNSMLFAAKTVADDHPKQVPPDLVKAIQDEIDNRLRRL